MIFFNHSAIKVTLYDKSIMNTLNQIIVRMTSLVKVDDAISRKGINICVIHHI